MTHLTRVAFWLLTAVACVTFAVFLRQMANPVSFPHLYVLVVNLGSQGILTIWCIRDLYRRPCPEDRTKLNWFAALLFLGVLARRRRPSAAADTKRWAAG